jgi:hypothetical protein
MGAAFLCVSVVLLNVITTTTTTIARHARQFPFILFAYVFLYSIDPKLDITIGTTISTRYHSTAWRDMLGNFINDVAMRVNFQMYNSNQMSRLELLQHVSAIHSSILERTSFPVCI